MFPSLKENPLKGGLLAQMSTILDKPGIIEREKDLDEAMKRGDLFWALVKKAVIPSPVTMLTETQRANTAMRLKWQHTAPPLDYQYGFFLASPFPTTLVVGQSFSLLFQVIDKQGHFSEDFTGEICEIRVESEVGSRRPGTRREPREVLMGAKGRKIVKGEGALFPHLTFSLPSSRAPGGKFLLQVFCRTDRRIKPLDFSDVEVFSNVYRRQVTIIP